MINISAEDTKLFENNGFTKEQVGATVQHYRDQGLSDEDIQARMNAKINEFRGENSPTPTPKGIDLTPSGLVKQGLATVAAPIRGAIYGEDFKTARQNALGNVENFKPLGGTGDFLVDMAAYSRLPVLKGGGVGRFVGNAVIQGGVPGALEGLKEGENLLESAGIGTGIAGGINTLLAGVPRIGIVARGIIDNPNVQSRITKGLEALTSVPQEYSQRALDAELAGNSLFKGKFDAKTAYRPIEERLTTARNVLKSQNENIIKNYKRLGQEVRNKLNAETMPASWYDEQYKNIGFDINKKMQDSLKPDEYFDTAYNQLGQRVLSGIDNLKNAAGSELNEVLEKMVQTPQKIGGLKKAVNDVIKNYARGGDFNPAEHLSGRDLDVAREGLNIGNDNPVKPIDIHNIKEFLYTRANYNVEDGSVLKGVANQLNNYLRQNPNYAAANDKLSHIYDLIKGIGGDDARTIATRLRNYSSGSSIRSGADGSFRGLDAIMPYNERFLNNLEKLQGERAAQEFLQDNIKQGTLNNIAKYDNLPYSQQELLNMLAPDEIAKYKNLSLQQGQEELLRKSLPETILNDISKYDNAPLEIKGALDKFVPDQLSQYQKLRQEQVDIKDVLKIISEKYENSPRPLADKNSLKFENALANLENKSGINITEQLNDIRAREALENLFPGQGGGSGSSQGFGNLLRTAIIGGAPTASAITGNPTALLGLAAISPKIMAKGTIQNVGRLYRGLAKEIPTQFNRLINPLAVRTVAPLLYGGISNTEDY